MRIPCWLLASVAVLLLLPLSCATSPEGTTPGGRARVEAKVVQVDELPDGRLRLAFEPVAADPALEVLRVEEARAVLAAFQESFQVAQRPRSRPRPVLASTGAGEGQPEEWESRLKEEYLSRYGPPLVALPSHWRRVRSSWR